MFMKFGHGALLAALTLLLAAPADAADGYFPGGLSYQSEVEGDQGGGDAAVTTEVGDKATEASAEEAAPAEEPQGEVSIYRELKTVEADVNQLKEKVFRSKARLMLLEEKVIRGVVSGAKALIRHVNNLGPSYLLESITYYFDGNPIFQKTDVNAKGGLSKEKKLQIYEANVPPGNHTLSVNGVIRGRGTGIFAYLADYTFQFQSSYNFDAQDGRTTRLDSVLFKKGGAFGDYIDGPAVEFREKSERGGAKSDEAKGAEVKGTEVPTEESKQ